MKKFLCFLLILCISGLNGCVEKKTAVINNNNYDNSIIYNIGKVPDNLIIIDNKTDSSILTAIFQGLVKYDSNNNIVGALAENYTISDDKLTYKFNIRSDAKWSDGSKITANDFVNFFKECLKKNINNNDNLDCIYGVKEYRSSKSNFSNVAINALDDSTFQIRLNYPCDYLLSLLTLPEYTLRVIDSNLDKWKDNYKQIKYSGPYIITSMDSQGSIRLGKNNYYWNKNNLKNNNLIFSTISNDEAAFANFITGKINVLKEPPINQIEDLKSNDNINFLKGNTIIALAFNLKNRSDSSSSAYTLNNDFRSAVSLYLDRSIICSSILKNKYDAAVNYLNYNDSTGLDKAFFQKKSSKDKANELIEKIKLTKDYTFNLIYMDSIENKLLSDTIISQINNSKLNLNIQAVPCDEEEFKQKISDGKYDLALIEIHKDFDSPISLLKKWEKDSPYNSFGYNNEKFNNIMVKLNFEKNDNIKNQYIHDGENILMSELPFIPIGIKKNILCVKNNINGIFINKNENLIFEEAYISK
ncbi:MAG: peptide transporter substrate-binding protein [Clostridiaceae bacterium]|nr:peptide transporter substrate-binding protein [Clostridiaceae bacterium]